MFTEPYEPIIRPLATFLQGEPTDEELMAQIQQQDEQALGALVELLSKVPTPVQISLIGALRQRGDAAAAPAILALAKNENLETAAYPVSNAYGLTNVPSIFWIAQDGEIEVSSVGWIKKEAEELNERAARASSDAIKPLFRADEHIADFRAG